MRGNPRLELALVLGFGLLLLFPLSRIHSRSVMPSGPASEYASTHLMEVWIDVRFSHPPTRVELYHGDALLEAGEGETRWDLESFLPLVGDRLVLSLRVDWPEDIENAYTEIAVEPEGRARRVRGFWSRGSAEKTLEFPW